MGEVVRRTFSPVLRFSLSPILVFLLIAGCSKQTGPDSNTAVFKTAEQAKAFASWDKLKDTMKNAGVKGSPQIWFTTKADK